ncbi:MAG: HDIG domain-containing protein [Fusobacteria bacterium]|nr:HDIG domain-containing protein [Fusobacteriota bacterium]
MREKAYSLLLEYNQSPSLIKHALAVEGVMKYFAQENNENKEYWGIVGLLHDIDYEMYPDQHCQKCKEILANAGYNEDFINSVVSHGYGLVSDLKPKHYMEKVLFATDELTGLITAAALMRPSKSVMDIEVKSVKKKFKDKAFAASIDRDIILQGCEMLDLSLDELIEKTILGMRTINKEIGL